MNRGNPNLSMIREELQALTASLTAALEKRKPLDLFDGKGDVQVWIDKYEKRGKIASWSQSSFANQLSEHLTGLALAWYEAVEANESIDIEDWPALRDKMLETFRSPTYKLDLARELQKKWSGGEDILMFFEQRRLTCARLKMSEEETVRNIITSLRSDMVEKLARKNLTTEDALRHELRFMARKVNKEAENKDNKKAEGVVQGFGRRFERQMKPIECFTCGKQGHKAMDCTAPQHLRGRVNPFKWTNKGSNNNKRLLPDKEEGVKRANKVEIIKEYMPFVMSIRLNGMRVQACLDTGASMTCVDAGFYSEHIGQEGMESDQAGIKLLGAGGHELSLQVIMDLTVELVDSHDKMHCLKIKSALVKDLGSTVLLGMDFLKQAGLTLCTKTGKVWASDSQDSYPLTCDINRVADDAINEREMELTSSVPKDENGASRSKKRARLEEAVEESLKKNLKISREIAEKQEESLTYGGRWGEEWKIPTEDFADDPTEERENPYIYQENTQKMSLEAGELSVGKELSVDEQAILRGVLSRYESILAFDGKLGDCTVLEHEIRTGRAKPINTAPKTRSRPEREAVMQQMSDWLRQGLIRRSMSPWATRVVTVLKKDNTLRCCVDYRALNSVTERDVYPLPTREEIMGSLEGMRYFSSLDLNQGYLQIRVNQGDIHKTAFVVQGEFYEFTRMPFGLTNAPATFQRLMDMVLAGLKWKILFVYLDDIIVFGETFEKHNENLSLVLERLHRANLTLKPSKCAFAVNELKFLGQVINSEGVRMDPAKVEAIANAPAPSSVTEVRSFVGLASYYRNFVKDFAKIAEPLTRLTQKNAIFKWSKDQQDAYEKLKIHLTSEPTLCHFNASIPVELRTDASGVGMGAVLLHIYDNGDKRVLGYASRQFKDYEKNYGITEKECLAIVWAVEKFRIYLQGIKFRVVTDHLALTWLQGKKELTGRLMRWANILQPYHFEVFYKSGKLHKDADHLSRFNMNRIECLEDKDSWDTNNPGAWQEVMMKAQKTDPDCISLIKALNEYPDLVIEEGLLVHRDITDLRAPIISKVLVTQPLIPVAIGILHRGQQMGVRKTIRLFKERFFIDRPSLVRDYIKTAPIKQINHITYGRRGTRWTTGTTDIPTPHTVSSSPAPPSVDIETIKTAQSNDRYCQSLLRNADRDPRISRRQGLLIFREGDEELPRIVLPDELLSDVLYALHDDPTSGHCGYSKTLWKFRQRYFSPKSAAKVKNYVNSCHLCQTRKSPWTRKYGLLQPLELMRTPFGRIGVDTLGPFRRSSHGHEKIIVITDYMTKYAIARPIISESAEDLAKILIEDVFLVHGAPETILTDRGKSFRTQMMRNIYEEFNIRHVTATAYHPQTNGLTERLNRTLAVMLSMYVNRYHADWDLYLPYVLFAYNSTKQDSTGYSPHYLLYGFENRTISDVQDPNPTRHLAGHFETLASARDMAIRANRLAQQSQAVQYNKGRYEQHFEVGDKVLVHRARGYIGQTTKLRHPYEGPYIVIERRGDLNYIVKEDPSWARNPKEDMVHVSRLKRYISRESR